MSIDNKTVAYVAHLSRIELLPQELEKLSRQLQGIVDFIDKLKQANVRDTSPTSYILPAQNVSRDDAGRQGLAAEKVLECAPEKEGNFYKVPKVIE